MRNHVSLRLPYTLADFHPAHVTYNVRRSFQPDGWGPVDQFERDFRTAQSLLITGSMPVMVARRTIVSQMDDFYRPWRIDFTPNVIVFDGADEYARSLRRIKDQGGRIAFQHVHPPGERPDDEYWIDRRVLSYVNDKANLGELAPTQFVPRRQVWPSDEFEQVLLRGSPFPFGNPPWVLKGAGPASSGGGNSVFLIHNERMLGESFDLLRHSEAIVIEEYLEVRDNFNLTFAAFGDQVLYLGASAQRTNASGKYLGNWFDPTHEPSTDAIAIGKEIARNALAAGYQGIAGFDMVVDHDDRLFVIDLNFRINGSTPALMWLDLLRRGSLRHRVAMYTREQFCNANQSWEESLRLGSQHHDLFVLGVCDTGTHTAASVVWFGLHREEIAAKRAAYLAPQVSRTKLAA